MNELKKYENEKDVIKLLEQVEIKTDNLKIFLNAFVHRSYLNENPKFDIENNERLEFLGDAVLELSVTKYLFDNYDKQEGELTALRSALVRGKNLSDIGASLGLIDCLLLSAGEKNSSEKARSLIVANALEAFIGAIYIDKGYDEADAFIKKQIVDKNIETIIKEKLYIDAKSEFQEKVQEKLKVTPKYMVLEQSGPDHNKIFICGVYTNDKLVAKAEGSSKNIAEQNAARLALETLFKK
jgi:ribonuclease-3